MGLPVLFRVGEISPVAIVTGAPNGWTTWGWVVYKVLAGVVFCTGCLFAQGDDIYFLLVKVGFAFVASPNKGDGLGDDYKDHNPGYVAHPYTFNSVVVVNHDFPGC